MTMIAACRSQNAQNSNSRGPSPRSGVISALVQSPMPPKYSAIDSQRLCGFSSLSDASSETMSHIPSGGHTDQLNCDGVIR